MKISMAGVDYRGTPLELREKLAFTESEIGRITKSVADRDGVSGCVIVSTCNRAEIYITSDEYLNAARLLFDACCAEYDEFCESIYEIYDYNAVQYLAEVACGLHSAILCEEQIVTQLGDAAELSRSLGCSNAVLNTMFRYAVTAGKKALTDFTVRAVPTSAAQAAVDKAEELYGTISGRKALVIGNGKMGLLAAETLIGQNCDVTITLRRYKHGDNIVPDGAKTIDYADRMKVFGGFDFVISATRSPHYTIYRKDIGDARPDYIFDLAVPRDVEPEVGDLIKCFNIDNLQVRNDINAEIIGEIKEVAAAGAANFRHWMEFKEGLE